MTQSASTLQNNDETLACTPSAIPAELRPRWIELAKQVYAAAEEVQELTDGYRLRLPQDQQILLNTAEYISLDRLCCAFVRWQLTVEPQAGALWLELTGGPGVKDVLRFEFEAAPLLPEAVAQAAGFRLDKRTTWSHPDDPALRVEA